MTTAPDPKPWLDGIDPAAIAPAPPPPPSAAVQALFAEQREEAVTGVRDALAAGVPAHTVAREVAAYGVTPEAVRAEGEREGR